jgi:hypothetical protein
MKKFVNRKKRHFTHLYAHLVWFIEQTNTMTNSQGIHIIVSAAIRELIRLHIVETNNALRHDATVPGVAALAFFPCAKITFLEGFSTITVGLTFNLI